MHKTIKHFTTTLLPCFDKYRVGLNEKCNRGAKAGFFTTG